ERGDGHFLTLAPGLRFDLVASHVDAALVAENFDVLKTARQVPRAFDDADAVVGVLQNHRGVGVGVVDVGPRVRRDGVNALRHPEIPAAPDRAVADEINERAAAALLV